MRMVFPSQTSSRLMDDLTTDVGTLMESFFGDVADRGRLNKVTRMAAPMDIDESDDAYLVTIDVPGVPIEAIEIDVHENVLSVTGQRCHASQKASSANESEQDCCEKGECKTDETAGGQCSRESKTLRRERSVGNFQRKVELPLPVEPDGVTAELNEGVLSVRLPKADPEKGKRRVPISRG